MFSFRNVLAVVVVCGMSVVQAATITWDGGGGNLSWQTPVNWSGDALPGVADDVIVNIGGSITVTSTASVTIRSLQCSNNLALTAGTFRVTTGDSVVQGRISITGSPTLSASGALASFTLAGATNLDGAGLEALSGARLSVPSLTSYNKGSSCVFTVWQAVGTNSVLDLPNLTNLIGAACGSLPVQATSGGTLLLTNLISVGEGTLAFISDGTNSLVDLRNLQQSPGTLRSVSFEAKNRGVIVMPLFPGGQTVTVALRSGGALPVEQLRELGGFTVVGTNVNFSALTNLTSGDITVDSNAVVTAPNLVSHQHPSFCLSDIWLVKGSGSVLDFSHLVSLSGANCGALNVQATAGGNLILSNLNTVIEGAVNFTADGTNSVVDLSALQQTAASIPVTFGVANAGTILMPLFPGSPNVSVSLASGGVLPIVQLRELSGFSVVGMNITFPALTNLTLGNISVTAGATVSVPNLVSHNHGPTCSGSEWLVSGAGSVLDLSNLSALTGAGCGTLFLSAKAGGVMTLNNLPATGDGVILFTADGTNSVVNLSTLSQVGGSRTITFSAANAGTILVPLVTGNTNVIVTIQSGGVFPAAQMRRLLGFTVTGLAVNFSALTNLAAGNVTVNGGGIASAPNLKQHFDGTACIGNTWLASGAGSVLDFSGLTNLTGAACGSLSVSATAGGHVLLGNLSAIPDGTIVFLADGTNSVLDLSSLTQSLATVRTVSFEARNAGTILVPLLEGGVTVAVLIKSGGTLDTSQLRVLKSLTVSGTSLNLPGITNLFAGDLVVELGAVLRLPNVFRNTPGSNCTVNTWSATGAGSVLDLSSMTNITGSTCGSLAVSALAGGLVNLSNLVTISDGTISFLTDGTNSRLDLSKLQSSLASTRTVSFESRNAGAIAMPQMAGGTTVGVIIKTNGVISIAQLQRLNSIVVIATNATFSSLTNMDNGSLFVSNNATVAAPGLVTYLKDPNCIPLTWIVSGTGSVLNLPALSQLTGEGCQPLDVRAVSGGQILLASLTNILSGSVTILSSNASSLVNLSGLINFLNSSAQSRLTATNGGTLVIDHPFILSGVTVSIAGGTPGLPAASLAPTNLIVHGVAWHSYQVDNRDSSSPLNPWVVFSRVPLTNDFQIIGPLAVANAEFRISEFVPDPFYFQLIAQSGGGVIPILYGPTNHGFEVLSAANLAPPVPWQTYATVTLSNTFRILPLEPTTLPQRFFKVVPQ